jgi:hypothetical protein
MQIATAWMPFELHRRARLFFCAFQRDADIRYPESRLRVALELRSQLSTQDRALFENLLSRFQLARRKVSLLDLPLLVEWTERKDLAMALIEIRTCLENSPEKKSPAAKICGESLLDIAELMRSSIPETDPSFWDLLKHRWKFAALRDEAHYLLDRFRSLR